MEKGKIKVVIAVNSQGSSCLRVGYKGITEIRKHDYVDASGRLQTTYNAYKGGNLFKQFINLPVEVEYFA